MTERETAQQLVDKYRPMMYCFVGSEMLTNTFNEPEQIRNAKQCALIAVDLILDEARPDRGFVYWQDVKKEIELL